MSSKIIENSGGMNDPLLIQLDEAVGELAEDFVQSKDHALFVIGAKLDDTDPENAGIQNYVNVAGFFGILEEALYSELRSQIEGGNVELYLALRNVIQDLQEDLGIDPDEDFGGGSHDTLH